MVLSYEELRDKLKKGTRKGNWKKLNRREKALYRVAMAYTKSKKWGEKARDIVNKVVVEKLLALIGKLMETQGMRIFNQGRKKADELLQKGEENGLFAWVPRLRYWLKDSDYIFWLGATDGVSGEESASGDPRQRNFRKRIAVAFLPCNL